MMMMMMMMWLDWIIPRWLLALILTPPILVAIFLYSIQSNLIYPSQFPQGSRTLIDLPDKYNLPFDRVVLYAIDKTKLDAYYIRHPNPKLTVLYLHANAGNMGHRLPVAQALYHHIDSNILMLSYRGYGQSEGTPNEAGIRLDAQAALDYLTNMIHDSTKLPLIVFGQSIGAAVAINLVKSNPTLVNGLIIENTFLSIPKLIPSVFPILKHFTFLCHQIWPSYLDIQAIPESIPILFLASIKDEIIPHSHMLELKTLASMNGGVRVWVTFPLGTHNDTPMQTGYFQKIQVFVNSHIIL